MAEKKKIDAEVEAKKKEARDFEAVMRTKAGNVGNIVGKNVPVSQTEVRTFADWIGENTLTLGDRRTITSR